MSPRHAGESRIADQALIDQVRAWRADWSYQILRRPLPLTQEERDEQITDIYALCGRAAALLEQIGGMSQ